MNDDVMWMVVQLEQKGVSVVVACSNLGWVVSTASGDDIIRNHSAREVYSFLAGLLFGTTKVIQQIG